MASNELRTIIVDTDLRKPKLHEFFQVPNGRGLTNKHRTALKNGAYKYSYSADKRRRVVAGKRILAGLQHAWNSLTLAIRWRGQGEGS